MYIGILADALVAVYCLCLHSDEQSDVKVDSKTKQWLNTFAVFVSHGVNREEHHPQCLLVAVRLAQRCSSILVEANVRCTSAQNRHVRECHTQETIVG